MKIIIFTVLVFLSAACNSQEKDSNDVSHKDIPTIKQHTTESEEPLIILPDDDLQKGDRGETIQLLQSALVKIGYDLETTSIYDGQTIWAITDLQLQHEHIYTTGIYDHETKIAIQNILDNKETIDPESKLSKPKGDQKDQLIKVLENPYEVLSLVNKEHSLPADYIPIDLVIPNVGFPFAEDLPKKKLRRIAADALEEMFNEAEKAGFDLFAQSGYRSYDRQDVIFASNVKQHGEEGANNFSARPGESEHQSGLTMDITSPNVDYQLTTDFGNTEEGKWVQEHASDFGFIIRYPKGKEDITMYQYEPWHLRYVGKRAAKEIMEQNITLEEYLEGIFSDEY